MLRKKIASRWMVFACEQVLIAVTWSVTLLTTILLSGFQPESSTLLVLMGINQLIAMAAMLLLRTHHGIIRYAELRDVGTIFQFGLVQASALVTTYLITRTDSITPGIAYFTIILNFPLSSLTLISFRLMIKHIYSLGYGRSANKESILIYGAGERGLAIGKAITDTDAMGMLITGFIEDDPSKIGKQLIGKTVIGSDAEILQAFISRHKVKKLIIATRLPAERKAVLTNLCADLKVRLHTLPPVQEWLHGSLDKLSIQELQVENLLEREEQPMASSDGGEEFRDATVMVTGAAGSVGLAICRQLCQYPIRQLILLDIAESGLHDAMIELKPFVHQIDIQMELANIREEDRINRLMSKHRPEFVFHAASYNHPRSTEHFPAEIILTNVKGTKVMADAAIRHKVRKFVLISSNKAVHPTNLMGACKRVSELYIQLLHSSNETDFIVTRFGNVLGTSSSVVAQFRQQIEEGGPVTVSHPGSTRYFIPIGQAAALILEAGAMGSGGDSFIFDMGQPVKLVDLAEKAIKLSGRMPGRDIRISFTGLRPGEKIFEQLISESEKLTKTTHPRIMKVRGKPVNARLVDTIVKMICMADELDESIVQKIWEMAPELEGEKAGGTLRYIKSNYQSGDDNFMKWKTSNQ